MKRITFFLFTLTLSLQTKCQNFQGQVFTLGENYLSDQCKVRTSPPWGEIFFYSNDRFVLTNYGNTSDTSTCVGKYSIIADTVKLTFLKFGSDLVPNTLNQPLRKNKTQKMKPEKFIITRCNEKVILRNYITKSHSFGSRNEKKEASWMNDVRNDKLYSKIKEELER